MPLADLNDDVLAEILSVTDVYTVLCASRVSSLLSHATIRSSRMCKVNSRFRTVALEKQLWMFLVRDLQSRGVIDLPVGEDFANKSTHDLISEVKRLVLGPETWAPAWTTSPVLRRHTVQPIEPKLSARIKRIKISPGGRYFALQSKTLLTIFDAETGKCVQKHTRHSKHIRASSFDRQAIGPKLGIIFTTSDAQQCVSKVHCGP
jgi:hypothetical protein